MSLKEQAGAWLKTIVSQHLSARSVQYRWSTYLAEPNIGSFGFQVDLDAQEGKIVAQSDDFILMKTAPTKFFIALKTALASIPEIGSTCKITPYFRRRFDGRPLSAPDDERTEGGVVITTFKLGERRSFLPFDKASFQCPQLQGLARVVEDERADPIRTIGQALIDAGALLEPISVNDPKPTDIFTSPPSLRFRVKTTKHDGYLSIIYDRGLDSFSVSLADMSLVEVHRQNELFMTPSGISDLGAAIVQLIDDGEWRLAKVEVLKAAPRKRTSSLATAAN
jgi:hypothetical protein